MTATAAAQGDPSDTLTRKAIATTVGAVGAVYIALLAGFDNPYWAGLSAMVIANSDRDELFTKGLLRIAGTFIGVFVGYVGAQLLEGFAIGQAAAAVVAAGIAIYGRQRSAFGYAWFYGGATFLLVIVASISDPGGLYDFAQNRCYEIVTGVTAATLASWALGPGAGGTTRIVAHPPSVTPADARRLAYAAALGTLAILIAWTSFSLPSLTQVIVSSLIVIDANPVSTRHRGLQRIIGCFIGGAAGLMVIGIDATSFIWWIAALSLGIYLAARIHLGGTANAYIGTQTAIAFLVTMVDSGPPTSILPPVERLVGIILGVALMSLVTWAVAGRPRAAAQA
ncbi:Fusaric acid resistance protein family protein [Kaistia soli DSM 19436]|uniref:Fusaric acid resistance protein family protein n=1 Tax=Kaistia soli DSM 19436 TaxID=1122133 RepID=A0A1M4WWR7_9HYPH|nr:FUSC family protein [Kaistia soli]SHE85513.1 Fusaric acid resistance protein family protein [Kaistia soli DSM 19436]